MADYLPVLAALALYGAVLHFGFEWLDRLDREARRRLRADRIAADGYAVNHAAEVLPRGVPIGRAMLLAAERGVSVEEAAMMIHQEQTMRMLKRILDPHPFYRRRRP